MTKVLSLLLKGPRRGGGGNCHRNCRPGSAEGPRRGEEGTSTGNIAQVVQKGSGAGEEDILCSFAALTTGWCDFYARRYRFSIVLT